MTQFTYKITDPLGLHARPAGLMVKILSQRKNVSVTVQFKDKSADGKRLYQILGLAVKTNDEITVLFEGENEELIANEIHQLFIDEKL